MRNVVVEYIDFLYSELGAEEAEKLLATPPGVVLLKNSEGFDLFEHPHVKLWHRFLVEHFEPEPKPLAMILPCTGIKPYRLSPTHRIVDVRLKKLGIVEEVSVYIMSEPMILVPRELDIYYPFANYDYPPNQLSKTYRARFVEILCTVIPKLAKHKYIVAVLPRHHRSILLEALHRSSTRPSIEIYEYGRLAFRSIAQAVDMLTKRGGHAI